MNNKYFNNNVNKMKSVNLQIEIPIPHYLNSQ